MPGDKKRSRDGMPLPSKKKQKSNVAVVCEGYNSWNNLLKYPIDLSYNKKRNWLNVILLADLGSDVKDNQFESYQAFLFGWFSAIKKKHSLTVTEVSKVDVAITTLTSFLSEFTLVIK